jgi:hypothetical protein
VRRIARDRRAHVDGLIKGLFPAVLRDLSLILIHKKWVVARTDWKNVNAYEFLC